MGTAVLFDVRDTHFPEQALDGAVSSLRTIEAAFSVFLPDSEISRIVRGDLAAADATPEVRDVLATCDTLKTATNGAFDHEPDGALDPSGYVKGWAVQRAAGVLSDAGIESFLISAGGDIVARGAPDGSKPWRVGIRDPIDPKAIVGTVDVRDGAVATSGRYERGDHIWSAHDRDDHLASVSIVGPDLGIADALATAAFAAGLQDIAWIVDFPAYDLIAVTEDRRILRSPGVPFAPPATA